MDFKVCNISKVFKKNTVLNDISFDVNAGELVSIVGPSGAGKTTLLKIIAGIEKPDKGEVIFKKPVSLKNPVVIVFQDYVLFPSLTVKQNIEFGLKARKINKLEIKQKVNQMLEYFKLSSKKNDYPAQLSAGQKQRVAIARAMIINPAVLLLDEPFANLDRNLKMETAQFIKNTQKEFHTTTISVTHDLEEAFAMSDKMGILLNNCIQQFDTPEKLYFFPKSVKTAKFLGPVNIITKDLFNLFSVTDLNQTELLVRPENLLIDSCRNIGVITEKVFAGHYFIYTIAVKQHSFIAYSNNSHLYPGQKTGLRIKNCKIAL